MAFYVSQRFVNLARGNFGSVSNFVKDFSSTASKMAEVYRAAVLRNYGDDLCVEEMKRPKMAKDQVRVAVHSCGVNASDVLRVENKYNQEIKLPFVPGFEICGEVLEVGENVKSFSVGSRVIGMNQEFLGGFSEECLLKEKDLWMVDHAVSFDNGAALVDCYTTALIGLARRANIKEGSTVLVTAAAGGLGLAAVDLAANVYKAKVIGVCGAEDKADLVRQMGAWAAVKYHPKHISNKVKEVTNDKGVDVIFDAVGGELFADSFQWVAHEGCVIVAGFASRVIPHIETSQLLPKAVSLVGISLSNYRGANWTVYRESAEDVIEMHESGLIRPHISAKFSLEETKQAFQFITERKSTGKVVLSIRKT